jgi:hypothetical protein
MSQFDQKFHHMANRQQKSRKWASNLEKLSTSDAREQNRLIRKNKKSAKKI